MPTYIPPGEGRLLQGEAARYDSSHDANMRLAGTLLRYKGEPFYCKGLWDDEETVGKVSGYFPLGAPGDVLIAYNDADLDVSSAPLGFANFPTTGMYLTRAMSRNQAQGVVVQRLTGKDLTTNSWSGVHAGSATIKCVAATIAGRYPSLDSILYSKKSGGFTRHWGIGCSQDPKVWVLYNRTLPVGFFIPEENLFLLEKASVTEKLKESLQKALMQQGSKDHEYHVQG